MSLLLPNRYPGRFDPTSVDYPQGKFKNRTAPGAKDGSYLERDWANDQLAFFGALLNNAGIVPDGSVDTAQVSQLYDALVAVVGTLAPDATTEVKGLVELATTVESEAGTPGVVPDAAGVLASIQANSLQESQVQQTTGQSTTDVMSQKAVSDQIIGVGQTWQDVTSIRVNATTYTNTTGRSIAVSVSTNSALAGAGMILTVNSVEVARTAAVNDEDGTVFTIVPPGGTYNITGLSTDYKRWRELR